MTIVRYVQLCCLLFVVILLAIGVALAPSAQAHKLELWIHNKTDRPLELVRLSSHWSHRYCYLIAAGDETVLRAESLSAGLSLQYRTQAPSSKYWELAAMTTTASAGSNNPNSERDSWPDRVLRSSIDSGLMAQLGGAYIRGDESGELTVVQRWVVQRNPHPHRRELREKASRFHKRLTTAKALRCVTCD